VFLIDLIVQQYKFAPLELFTRAVEIKE